MRQENKCHLKIVVLPEQVCRSRWVICFQQWEEGLFALWVNFSPCIAQKFLVFLSKAFVLVQSPNHMTICPKIFGRDKPSLILSPQGTDCDSSKINKDLSRPCRQFGM